MNVTKAAVSVSEMARMVGLSRAQFYAYMGTVFPHPLYRITNRRPFYDADLQRECLSIRQTGIGHNGQYVLFNAPRRESPPTGKRCGRRENGRIAELLEAVRHLGLEVTKEQLKTAVSELYPSGLPAIDAETIRKVFHGLRRSI